MPSPRKQAQQKKSPIKLKQMGTKRLSRKRDEEYDEEEDSMEIDYDYEVDSLDSSFSVKEDPKKSSSANEAKKPPVILVDQEVQTEDTKEATKDDRDGHNS